MAPDELEDVIHSHPQVADAAVVGLTDEWTGEVPKTFMMLKLGDLLEKDVYDFVSLT